MATIAGTLTNTAARVPDRVAIVDGDQRITYAELDLEVNRVAHALAARGLGKGDRCALMGLNSPGFIIAFYAIMRLGALHVPINPRLTAPETQHLLDDAGVSVIVADPAVADVAKVARARSLAGSATPVLTLGPHPDHEDLLALAAVCPAEPPEVVVHEDDDAMILYTSGTTGRAKGALHDHHRVLWTALSIPIGTFGMCDGERLIHVAPLYHSGQLTMMLIPGVLLGAVHVIVPGFDPAEVLDLIERERITAFFGVPTMYRFLLADPHLAQRDLSSWRIGVYGAAPMPAGTASNLLAAFPGLRLFSCYGQTEAGPSGFFSNHEQVQQRPDAAGFQAFPSLEVRLGGPDDVDVPIGEVGEILLRGETVMKGYWRNPEGTAQVLRNGWLHTGDLGRRDPDGFLCVVDRMKDLIISGGANIYSVEVEQAVATHPMVADCAVVGVPHPIYGETVVAVVDPRAGTTLDLDDLRKHCADRIAGYKLPRRLVLRQIPRNASGKVLKRELRADLTADG